ncbi:MAG: transposase [Flavobacteriaceae bacterium]|nr:transposase [Flavobacteriaceae bacterium]
MGDSFCDSQTRKKRGSIQQISQVIQDTPLNHLIHHSIPKLFRQRVYQLILGYPDGHDVERLRWDAVFKL